MPNNPARVGPYSVGTGQPLLLIAGPCVLEENLSVSMAAEIRDIQRSILHSGLELNVIFKGSFDKANRTSLSSWRGPGLARGLQILSDAAQRSGLPVTTDIHESGQAAEAATVCDLIQIPAFLARQTDLLRSAAQTGKAVHVKKGQFMSPYDMRQVIGKLEESGCSNILLGERGTFFGYGQLVNDFRSLVIMRKMGVPVVFDATHSVQQPGGQGDRSGGQREYVVPLARAAAAVGIDALFLEVYPEPDQSPCDGPNMIPLDELENLIRQILAIRAVC